MSTVGIVALSVLGGMLGLAMVAAIGILIWLAFDLRRLLKETKSTDIAVQNKIEAILLAHQADLKATIESAKASFGGIRNDSRAQLETQRKEITETLAEHRQRMQQAIDKINAEALAASAAKAIEASLRMEKAIAVFQRFLTDNIERTTNDYGPDDYAPEGNEFGGPPSFFGVGTTSRLDDEAERETAAVSQESGAV